MKKENLGMFLSALSLSLVGFLLIYGYGFLGEYTIGATNNMDNIPIETPVYIPSEEDGFEVFLMIVEDDFHSSLFAGVIEINPTAGSVSLDIIENREKLLEDYVATGISSLLPQSDMPYIIVNQSQLDTLIKDIGNIRYNMPLSLKVQGITLEEGMVVIDNQIISSLLEESHKQWDYHHYNSICSFILDTVISSYIAGYSEEDNSEDFFNIVNNSTTNIHYNDYLTTKNTMEFLAKFGDILIYNNEYS